jgi:hypothetical protein
MIEDAEFHFSHTGAVTAWPLSGEKVAAESASAQRGRHLHHLAM